MTGILKYLKDFANLIFPEVCAVCDEGLMNNEKVICTKCLYHIPKTNFVNNPDNEVAKLFWGRTNIQNATSFFYFNKGSNYQKLIHKLKYKAKTEIGFEMGKIFGTELKSSKFNEIDIIVPVPLHKIKFRKRGFNQCDFIARGISEILKKPVDYKCCYRKIFTDSQTKKSRYERWENVDDIFDVNNPEIFTGKHILLVDDVVTTGSTLEACANALLKINDTRISVATLAIA